MSPSKRRDEAAKILRLVEGSPLKAFELVERQLGVLVLRTQVMLSLSGIVVTVTGFSGRAIAETSDLARASIVLGVLVVLLAAGVAFGGVLRLRWLTEALTDDPIEMLVGGLELRDKKGRNLKAAIVLFVVGFTLYVIAIAQLLAAARPAQP